LQILEIIVQFELMNKIFVFVLVFLYLIFVLINRNYLFQKFDTKTVPDFLRSQDILDEKDEIKNRIFVSDETIYIASGYLYVSGEDPRDYNFQHPPLIKYFFGLSSKFFNLPLFPNIIFGFVLLLEIYLLCKLVFKNEILGFLTSILMLIDPVFKEVTIIDNLT